MRSLGPLSDPEWLSSLPSTRFKFIVFNTKPEQTVSRHAVTMETGAVRQKDRGCQRSRNQGPMGTALKWSSPEIFVTLLFSKAPSDRKVGKFADQQATWMLCESPGCAQMPEKSVDQRS